MAGTKMTAFDVWLKTMVAALAPDCPEDTALAQRIAIGLIQARVLECRTLAGELNVSGDPHARMIAAMCMDRSHKLEKLGLEYAKNWPPAGWDGPGNLIV